MPSIVVPDQVGVFAFDPGGTTGVGWALMDVKDTVAKTLRYADIQTVEVTGDWKEQARKLRDLWLAVSHEWKERGLAGQHTYLIREDFNLYKFRSSDKKGVYPIWISAMLEGLLDLTDVDIIAQQVVQAKRFATNARLKRWGVYVPGSEHKRDAVRHIAFKLNKVI